MSFDELKANQDASRGARAEALLNDELLKEAFETLEAGYMELWRTSPPLEAQSREKLYLAINVIGKVRQHLQTVIMGGKVAADDLRMAAERKKRVKAA